MSLFGTPNIVKLRERTDVRGLIRALRYKKGSDEFYSIRRDAAEALGQIGDTRAVRALIAAFMDENEWRIHKTAAEALGRIGDVRAIKPLVTVLEIEYMVEVHEVAVKALGQIRAVEALIAILNDEFYNRDVRRNAIKELGRIGDVYTVEPLVDALKDEKLHREIRNTVVEALDQMGWSPGQDEAGAWYWMEKSEWQKCVEIGTSATKPIMAALMDGIGGKYAVDALDQLGWSPDQDEAGAWYWMEKSEWQKCVAIGVPTLVPLITTLCDHTQQALKRRKAAEALIQIGAPAVKPLIIQLYSFDLRGRVAAAESLLALYQSASLDDTYKDIILKAHERILQHVNHPDVHPLLDCRDYLEEFQYDINVKFPQSK